MFVIGRQGVVGLLVEILYAFLRRCQSILILNSRFCLQRNKAQCHPVVCPTVECDNPVTLPGECCPACPKVTDNTNQTCYFPGDHREHRVGTVWHPFMHPGGYFKCAFCYCKVSSVLEIGCYCLSKGDDRLVLRL